MLGSGIPSAAAGVANATSNATSTPCLLAKRVEQSFIRPHCRLLGCESGERGGRRSATARSPSVVTPVFAFLSGGPIFPQSRDGRLRQCPGFMKRSGHRIIHAKRLNKSRTTFLSSLVYEWLRLNCRLSGF